MKEYITDLRFDSIPPQKQSFRLVQQHYNHRDIFLVGSIEEACSIIASDCYDGDGSLYGCWLEHDDKIIMSEHDLSIAADREYDWWIGHGPKPTYEIDAQNT